MAISGFIFGFGPWVFNQILGLRGLFWLFGVFFALLLPPLKIIKSFLILLYHLYSGFQMGIYCLFLNCITFNKKIPKDNL